MKSLDLQEDLGLGSETSYLVFDFWNKKFVGITGTTIREEIPAHGTKALIIRGAGSVPQLLATSRHLPLCFAIIL